MSDFSKPNYIKGSAKAVRFGDGNEIINLSLNKEELSNLPGDYCQITVKPRREADQYGNTHYVVENTYKPGEGKSKAPAPKAAKDDGQNNWDDNPPF